MDLFFSNLKQVFSDKNFIFFKNLDSYNLEEYEFVYETYYSENKYTVLSYKKNNILKPIVSVCIPTLNKNNYVLT